jgi:hypothetical protein
MEMMTDWLVEGVREALIGLYNGGIGEPVPDQWEMLQNDIATAIDDSMDIDWTAEFGARAVVEMLKAYGYEVKAPAEDPNP